MAYAFDTLGYSKRLREAGIDSKLAEAHAEAARDFIMVQFVTKADLEQAIDTLTLRLTVRLGGLLMLGLLAAWLTLLLPLGAP